MVSQNTSVARKGRGTVSASTTAADRIRALTGRRRIKPTSPGCRRSRRPEPGRRSTDLAAKPVQTNRAISGCSSRFDRKGRGWAATCQVALSDLRGALLHRSGRTGWRESSRKPRKVVTRPGDAAALPRSARRAGASATRPSARNRTGAELAAATLCVETSSPTQGRHPASTGTAARLDLLDRHAGLQALRERLLQRLHRRGGVPLFRPPHHAALGSVSILAQTGCPSSATSGTETRSRYACHVACPISGTVTIKPR